MAPSKKHHFVTQAQLRHFKIADGKYSVFVFDKQTGRSFQSPIKNAGSENHFNTVTLGETKWNFEHLFDEVDSRSAKLVAQIVDSESLVWMSADDKESLADFVAVQLLRTRFGRTEPKAIVAALRNLTEQMGYDPYEDPTMALPSEAHVRLIAVDSFLNRDPHRTSLLRLIPSLHRSDLDVPFVISDHPVVRYNPFPYGDNGLSSLGITVHIPLTPSMTLTMLCPSIVARYESLEELQLAPEKKEKLTIEREALRSGQPVLIDNAEALSLNRMQVKQSSRHIYSSVDEFEFVREMLKGDPTLERVETLLEVGELGMAPPPRADMPPGWQLVVFGAADHCMLPIQEFDEKGEGITAKTSKTSLVKKVAEDPGKLHVQLYQDRSVRREMREAMVEIINEKGPGWFRVVHRDQALRELGLKHDNRGK